MKGFLPLTSAVLYLLLNAQSAGASVACDAAAGRFVSVQGVVEVQSGTAAWRNASMEDALCEGDTIRVGTRSRAAVALINDAVLRIDENTTMRLVDITDQDEEKSWLDVVQGAIMSFSRKPKLLEVSTPYLNGSIEGTEFTLRVDEQESQLTVFEGVVVASNDQGSLPVAGGETVVGANGLAPQPRTLVRPRDAVQWALYYPPVIAAGGMEPAPMLKKAADLLSVGRVDEASVAVDKAIGNNEGAGLAYALRSVINTTQNDRDAALADAEKAVSLTDASAARIALSYAQQSGFRISEARDTMRTAVEQHPDDALALARLAELELMLGNRNEALDLSQKAASIAPQISRTELVLGFNALASFRNDEARAAFEKAIELDSADPLAHLGLGLTRISEGNLADGRRDLEAAVALDSSNAVMRAYLGKAYFEERRYPLDSQQYNIAKELDPLDPTAYLYDGILKQTANRPVEAIEEMERSIELNDNRAVFRSRLLLDKDRAARGTSLARAYNDLGFTQLGVNESAKSLSIDPSNASAHRFLADTYLGVRRTEIARVSELLQSQLMQDINIAPVQPSISTTDLNIVTLGGPAQAGFNEFTPLFQRNQTQFNITGFGGNKDTLGGEAVVSGIYDRFSYSVGAFTSDTDGWRENNGLDQEVYNIYLQSALTSELNVQAEFSRKESEEGDLAFNFDPDDFLADYTLTSNRDTARLGLRYTPSQQSTLLFSYIYGNLERREVSNQALDPFTSIYLDSSGEFDGSMYEGQYIYYADTFNVIAGAGYSDAELKGEDVFELIDIDFGPIFSDSSSVKDDLKHSRGYVYTNIQSGDSITWTLGASYDDFKQEPIEETSFNPKFGVQWQANENLLFRAAAFKVLKPSLVNNRTIEPTQVAGFNQFFDDRRGTESWRYGFGMDARINPELSIGAEFTWRDIQEANLLLDPATGEESTFYSDQDEQLHSLYAYWTPSERIGVSARFTYDRYEAEESLDTLFGNRPTDITTMSLPVAVTYFDPSGVFAALGGTYVNQDVERSPSSLYAEGEDSFFLVDAAIGYRFPKRRGIASIGVKNLFDEQFRYQDDSYRESTEEPSRGPYYPSRFILASVTLNF